MNEGDRKVIVTVAVTGAVSVSMIGGHLTKRELERALKAIKQERNSRIRMYNKDKIIAQAKIEAEARAKEEKEIEDDSRKE